MIVLVACARTKAGEAKPARFLYLSDLFQKAALLAELMVEDARRKGDAGAAWFVLSAKHRLLEPSRVTAPYDESLFGMGKREREAWGAAVMEELAPHLGEGVDVVLLAGKEYREPLLGGLNRAGCRVHVPMARMGIGRQKEWLAMMAATMRRGQADSVEKDTR